MNSVKFETVNTIGEQAFLNCKSLTSLIFNQDVGIDSISSETFYGCDKLSDIRIGLKTPPIIGHDVFNRYEGVRVSVPAGSVEAYKAADNWNKFKILGFSNSAFKYETYYDETLCRECAKVVGYESNLSDEIVVPDEVEIDGCTYSVTEIGDSAFYRCEYFSKITIAESVTKIGDYAFAETGQHYINIIPLGEITSLGRGAFSMCNLISNDIITNMLKSLSEIGAYTFNNTSCSEAVTINIPETVTYIGEYAFSGFNEIEQVNMPNSILSVGTFAFSNCKKLKTVRLSESLVTLSDRLFNGCRALDSIKIPDSVTEIGNYTFGNCIALKAINIPKSTVSLGREAFANCAFTNIDLPESIENIGDGVFASCRQLKSVTIPEKVTSIGAYAFMYCSALESVTLPENLTTIGERAFINCRSLTSMTLPESVKIIGSQAFNSCAALTSFSFPKSLTKIENLAFLGCESLSAVEIPEGVDSIGSSAFFGCI